MIPRRVDGPTSRSTGGLRALLAADRATPKRAAALLATNKLSLMPALLAGTQSHESPRLRVGGSGPNGVQRDSQPERPPAPTSTSVPDPPLLDHPGPDRGSGAGEYGMAASSP